MRAGAFELVTFADDRALANAAATDWLQEVAVTGDRRGPFCVALSGGRIARQFFLAVASAGRAGGLVKGVPPGEQGCVHFFWSDERCVPSDHPESNFALAHECWLGPLGIPAERIHRIRGEALPGQAAAEAEGELRRFAAVEGGRQPVLDLVFLGLGEDGHIASLFPGESEAVMASPAVYRPVIAAKPPPQRITLGYAAIAVARQVWVLVSGAGKAGALRASLSGSGQTPLARVLRQRRHTRILVDEKSLGPLDETRI